MMENYPYPDCDLSFCDQEVSPLLVPKSSFEVVKALHSPPHKSTKALIVDNMKKTHVKEFFS